jgi:hypothetical protein
LPFFDELSEKGMNEVKFPLLLRIAGFFQLLAGMITGIILLVFFVSALNGKINSYIEILTLTLLTGLTLWLILSSALLIFGHSSGFWTVVGYILVYLSISIIMLKLGLSVSDKKVSILLYIISFISAIQFIFFTIGLLYHPVKVLFSTKLPVLLPPVLLFLISFLPGLCIFMIQKLSVKESEIPVSVSSNGDLKGYPVSNLIDGKATTWWTPDGHEAAGSKISLSFVFDTVIGFKINNGSQEHKHPKYGDLFYKNSRLKKARIVYPYGYDEHEIVFEDKTGSQTVYFKSPIKTSHIEIELLESYPGTNWNDLSISELVPITRDTFFRE